MKMEQKFPNKRAFVSGAASGLGLAICERLAHSGWKLLIVDINESKLNQAERRLQELGAQTLKIVLDVTQYSALKEAADAALEAWGGIDLVFNNAGIATVGAFEDLSIEDWERTIDIDLWSVIYGCKVFTPMLMQQGGGYIINTASSAGTLAGPEMAPYNVAKAGVVSLSETLKVELGKYNIGVSVICPTFFVTSLGDSIIGDSAMRDKAIKRLETSKTTPEPVVNDIFSAIDRNKLYVMTQSDAKWGWRFKRYFPEINTRVMSYLYRNKKWVWAS